MAAELKGKVQTVLGAIAPSDLGITHTHEHLLIQTHKYLTEPDCGAAGCMSNMEIKMENLGKIQYFPYSVQDNLVLDSEEDAIAELKRFKEAGGSTVCDVTVTGIRLPDFKPESLRKISRETGVNIVAGTGFYLDTFQTEEIKLMSVQEMSDFMVKEILHGIGDSGVKCGIIGEVGCSWPLADTEKKSLRAAALAQQETGAPLIIHPGRDDRSPFEILDVLEASGADISRTVMSHLDRTIFDEGKLLQLAKRGCYLEYDLFGVECSHYQLVKSLDFPSDAQRIKMVKVLVDGGYSHRILLAQDIHTKHRLVRYGGHGYAHILEHIVPKMVDRGISRDTVMEMLTENPKKWLTFV